jgi:caffeoyl-CoA O-methyltransferase
VDAIIVEQVERYLDELASAQLGSPVLDEMERRARDLEFPIVGRAVGQLLELLTRSVGARRVVELGSGYGYSALWFARAVGADGTVVCSDLDEDNRAVAERFLTQADLWDRIDFRIGDAAEVLAGVDGEVDVVFCDADKERYPEHWANAAERIRIGGLYICDNTLWSGRAATGEPTPERPGWTEGIVAHNRQVTDDPRYVSSLVPIRDGVLVALRVA